MEPHTIFNARGGSRPGGQGTHYVGLLCTYVVLSRRPGREVARVTAGPLTAHGEVVSYFTRVVGQCIPNCRVPQLTTNTGVGTQGLSCSSRVCLLVLKRFLRIFDLGRLISVSGVCTGSLSHVHNVAPTGLGAFSGTGQAHSPKVVRGFF